jgi:hypothetical protein
MRLITMGRRLAKPSYKVAVIASVFNHIIETTRIILNKPNSTHLDVFVAFVDRGMLHEKYGITPPDSDR